MVRRAVLALIASAAVFYAVGEAPTEGAGDFLQSDPAPPLKDSFNPEMGLKETPETLPTYHVGMLYPEGGYSAGWTRPDQPWSLGYLLPEHDPLTAYVMDVGFTIPTPAPPPEPLVSASGALTEAQFNDVLDSAGWPEHLWGEARAIVRCESNFRPDALGDGGRSGGLFQLNIATWFRYAGEDASLWHDPLVNARTAWATYQYDIGRGYEPWKQWSCRKVLH